MARRVSLPLARTPPVRPVPALSRSLRPSAREAAVAALLLGLVALAYLGARQTSVFAVREVEVTGAPHAVEGEVRKALAPFAGTSLVTLDTAHVERRLGSIPSVRSASVDRAFPHGLVVAVLPERPLAVVREGRRAWLVAESGRVVGAIHPTARGHLPRIRVTREGAPTVGAHLRDRPTRVALDVLRAIPTAFPERVLYASVDEVRATLVLVGGTELRLGAPADVEAKLRAAGAVLRSLAPDERAAIGYLDASVPDRIVAGQTLNL